MTKFHLFWEGYECMEDGTIEAPNPQEAAIRMAKREGERVFMRGFHVCPEAQVEYVEVQRTAEYKIKPPDPPRPSKPKKPFDPVRRDPVRRKALGRPAREPD